MRQKHHHKANSAHKHESGKQTQVAQGGRIQRNECTKGSNGSDIAYNKWLGNLFQRGARRGTVSQMGNKMQGIVHGNADNHRGNAQHNDRNLTADKGYSTHRHHPTEGQREGNEREITHSPQGIDQQTQDQNYRNAYCPQTVGLDLSGIFYGDDGCSGGGDLHVLQLRFHLSCGSIYLFDELIVPIGLAGTERRVDHCYGKTTSRSKDATVVQFISHRTPRGLQSLEDRSEQAERVFLNISRQPIARRKEQHLLVMSHCSGDTISVHPSRHASIVFLVHQQRRVAVYKIRHTEHPFIVHPGRDGPTFGLRLLFEEGYSLHDSVDIHLRSVLHSEDNKDSIGDVGLPIEIHRTAIGGIVGQKIADIFFETQLQSRSNGSDHHRCKKSQAQESVRLKEVVQAQKKSSCHDKGYENLSLETTG